MKPIKLNVLLFAVTIATIFSSCRKDNDNTPEVQEIVPVRKGLYILSEGNFNGNNSRLTYYDYDTKALVADQFLAANSRGLGDTGNDVGIYGSKMYIVVNVSNTVEVVNAKTSKSISKISFTNAGVGRQPRYVVFNKNKAYVSSFDGTVAVIDTTSLAVEKYITVGRNPERMAIANGKLYVANSGGLDYPNYDKTVSVIDLATQTELKKITVTLNPRGVFADKYGDIYVLSSGDYGAVTPAMTIINSTTDVITKTFANFSAGSMSINGDLAYISGSNYDASYNSVPFVKVFNVKTEAIEKENFITDGTVITTPYGITVDTVTGEVFVTDAKNYATNGSVFCFDSKGVRKYTLSAGISPNGVAFINK